MDKSWTIAEPNQHRSLRDTLLANRGIDMARQEAFFNPSIGDIPDPFLFANMRSALSRVRTAVNQGERIIIFGDYDVDGVTGTAILVRTLLRIGAQVSYRLPHRVLDGYGLKRHLLDEMASKGVRLIITVDNGISAADEVAYAHRLGIDVIITDHHSVPACLPSATAILHPKVEDESYPFHDLSGSGVAYMFARALLEDWNVPNAATFWEAMVDVAALGTVADCVPLIGSNRTLVWHGLRRLASSAFPGLRLLLERAGRGTAEIDADTIGFVIAPRLNAAGRMDTPLDALHLFLQDETRAKETADRLDDLNAQRQAETERIADDITDQLSQDPPSGAVVVWGPYHVGVIGIVAARLVEAYGMPAIVMGENGEHYVGSCRSDGKTDIVAVLREVAPLLSRFGGHEAAAGFSMPRANAAAFKQQVQALLARRQQDKTGPRLNIEAELPPSMVDLQTHALVSSLGPFGVGNPKPVFAMTEVAMLQARGVGANGAHLKLRIRKDRHTLDGIWFRNGHRAHTLPPGTMADVAFTLSLNDYGGTARAELGVVDIRQ